MILCLQAISSSVSIFRSHLDMISYNICLSLSPLPGMIIFTFFPEAGHGITSNFFRVEKHCIVYMYLIVCFHSCASTINLLSFITQWGRNRRVACLLKFWLSPPGCLDVKMSRCPDVKTQACSVMGAKPRSGRREGVSLALTFLFLFLISCLYVGVQSVCSFVFVCRVLPPASLMPYAHSISVLFGFCCPRCYCRRQTKFPVLNIRSFLSIY